jgi:hypothetical protein
MGEWMNRSTFSWPRHYLEVSSQVHASAALTPEKGLGTYWIGGWVDPRAGLDDIEDWQFFTLTRLEHRPLCRPGRSQSLYRLRYSGSRCHNVKENPWPVSASELYRPSDRRLSAKVVPTFADRRSDVVSVTDPFARNLNFLDRSRYFFFQGSPQLYSRGWVDPVPDPLLLRKSGSAGNLARDL